MKETAVRVNLTADPEIITSQPAILVYLEKIGPFLKTAPLAWREFWSIAKGQFDRSEIAAMVALSRIDSTKTGDAAFAYQAGVTLKSKPTKIPQGLRSRELHSGKYARFLLTGSYGQLPAAYPQAFSTLKALKLETHDDFCIERYLNTPEEVSED
ncbi:MAG: GyrI-like domain-containing protein, partial [Alphaproteobacteria bacterium]|nr:GyrI-like domain-containing protein [Alphaproteobacteria bacterium]